MRKENAEILKLTAKTILTNIFGLMLPFYEASSIYRIGARQAREELSIDNTKFFEKVRYLKRQGLINSFVEGKERFIELTPKGIERAKQINIENITIERPQLWDKKWRVVIYDIEEDHKNARDLLRNTLVKLGFLKIQESVYVYPFDCTEQISLLSSRISESNQILIMISDIIQGENELIDKFLSKNILTLKDIKPTNIDTE